MWPGWGVIILLLNPEGARHLNANQNFSPTLAPTQSPFSNRTTISKLSDSDSFEIRFDLHFLHFPMLVMRASDVFITFRVLHVLVCLDFDST